MLHPKPHRFSLEAIRFQGIVVSILSYAAAVALPVLNYIWIYHENTHLSIETYVHWGIVGICGFWAILAIFLKVQWMLAAHTILGTSLAAALAALNAIRYAELDFKCSTLQSAYQGCASCVCAATNSCTKALLQDSTCNACQAISTDVCNEYSSKKIPVAITAAVTVVAMSIPVIYSLIVYCRLENARAIETTKINWLVLRMREQLTLLATGQPPSLEMEAIASSLQRLKETGVKENIALATNGTLALVKAGYSIPKVTDLRPVSPKNMFVLEETLNEPGTLQMQAWSNQVVPEVEAMMAGNSVYDMTATNNQTMITYSTQEITGDPGEQQPVEDISGATFEDTATPTVKKSKSKKGKGEEADVEMGTAGEKKKKKKKKDGDGQE